MFKDNLIALRKANHLSQEELAAKIDVSRQTLSKYETGESLPDLERSKALADVFGVSLDDLVNYEPTPEEGGLIPPKGKHMFGLVRVGEKGEIRLPKKARELFNIRPGDNLLILGEDGQGIAVVKPDEFLKVALHVGKLRPDEEDS